MPSPGDFELLARWEAWLRAQGLSEATIRLYGYGVVRLHREVVKGGPERVTEEHLTAFLSGMGKRATAKVQYFRGIRSFFGYCHARGFIPTNPAVGIRLRKPRRPPPVALTEDELIRYLIAAAWRSPRRAWALMLCFGLGTRRMEAAAIAPDDIQGETVWLRECKYGKQRRVEMSDYARAALEGLRPWWNGTVLGGVNRQTLTDWAHEAAVDSGLLPKVRGRVAHVLRASFATHLLRNGVPVQTVRDLMGHENISTTNDYAATFSDERAEAARRLRFGGTAPGPIPP